MASTTRLHCLLFLWLVSGGVVKCADDVDTRELQTLVQQQAAIITDLQAKVTALSNLNADVTELKNKVVYMTRAVAFSAMLSTDDIENGFPLSSHATLVFDNAVTNVGNGYNTNTGIFTAPVTGVYAFSLSIMVPNSRTYLELAIVKQGVVLDMAWAPNTAEKDDQGSTHVTTQLTAGEEVWVRQAGGDGVRGSYWTVFTGYLIQAQ